MITYISVRIRTNRVINVSTLDSARLGLGGVIMYAIIDTGGKQYRVQEGDTLYVEKLDASAGDTITLENVLAVSKEGSLTVGNPLVNGAKVDAKVVKQGKGKKIIIFKYKPKKDFRKKQGHRQPYTKLVIEKINA